MQVVGQLTLILPNTSLVTPAEQAVPAPLANLTNNQQALLFYYFLRGCDVKPRITVDLSVITRWMHLLVGKNLTSIENSGLYKCLQSVPDLNNPRALVRDFACIQPLLAQVGLKEALQLMEYDLALALHR